MGAAVYSQGLITSNKIHHHVLRPAPQHTKLSNPARCIQSDKEYASIPVHGKLIR